jgi:alpha-L-fucosidase 2
VRGGVTLDLAWEGGKPTNATLTVDANAPSQSMQVVYAGQTITSFVTKGGMSKKIQF